MVRGANGMQEIEQVAERTFQLTHGQMGLLNKRGDLYQLQVIFLLWLLLWQKPYPIKFSIKQLDLIPLSRAVAQVFRHANKIRFYPRNLSVWPLTDQA